MEELFKAILPLSRGLPNCCFFVEKKFLLGVFVFIKAWIQYSIGFLFGQAYLLLFLSMYL